MLRLRADAVHTANLLRQPACSLFVQAADLPARLLARVTLKGEVEQVHGPERDAVAGLHAHLHGEVGKQACCAKQQCVKAAHWLAIHCE